MRPVTVQRLAHLNQEFYQTFGAAFSRTRLRIQPGVRKFLESFPVSGTWLDLGCGNGYLARAMAQVGFHGTYFGLDNSETLLNEAKTINNDMKNVHFHLWDMSSGIIPQLIVPREVDGIMAFAVLHHLPGKDNRLKLLQAINACLIPGGIFVHSEWQFQHSPRLISRVQPWSCVGIADADVDEGDHLLDWRYALPGQAEQSGLRYVHIFTADELRSLAEESTFSIVEEWLSDGLGGRLSLYQVWRKE